ncbi:UDP-N-acetylmuramate dehydrogenase [Nitrosomonas oligotropha]|uniref:UDP-N-acetylenolpyruvoylglucosamine reductase n=2 Tax=Nitrosomonas oligotropha TaxID=42354 RepID=A0A1H8IX23_9PROT|nr:UDP-N-acetylmuramate dehydrogenase [Nitrosomonas oligotropha]SEN73021.1 UDP-N-acetylmuramate dehydrogenase [Nitrosomonas oligotropha]
MTALPQNTRFAMPVADQTTGEAGVSALRGEMRIDEPMSKHTTWRAGGDADRYYQPADLDDWADFLRASPYEVIHVIGLGSNLLVRDGGLRGTVVALHARLNDLRLIEQNQSGGLIYASAGVACAKVARFAAKHNLAGAEFLAGIPGTVGGALAMNAGCYGSETWEIVAQVQIIKRNGEIVVRQPGEYAIAYRSVKRQSEPAGTIGAEWFTGAYFRLAQGDQAQSRQRIKQLLAQRVASQPLNLPNAGSVFRNPPGDYAARLIEACGLKGCHIGGAMVSPKHANFIVNTGNASAADIEALIMMVQSRVKKATGIALIQEVRIIGDARRLT